MAERSDSNTVTLRRNHKKERPQKTTTEQNGKTQDNILNILQAPVTTSRRTTDESNEQAKVNTNNYTMPHHDGTINTRRNEKQRYETHASQVSGHPSQTIKSMTQPETTEAHK
jgi:hypothetical protein